MITIANMPLSKNYEEMSHGRILEWNEPNSLLRREKYRELLCTVHVHPISPVQGTRFTHANLEVLQILKSYG